ncbi:hypothetical protein [Pedobacter cryoconitis]|uniref:hypothetical protein n=1 Tax=Pedobacter cryoconitis TaxID=188932 RepID=UPI0016099C1F|nr:hypothetical protein [Pedobacter cryoconitis]MBB5648338.1 hypothetical protein [Pedobacter cryoconitis]
MNNRRLHISRIFATLLLMVFAIALTPWSSLHHHEEQPDYCVKDGKECLHKFHVGSERHNCLICSAHFEKDYYTTAVTYQAALESKSIVKNYALISASYTVLISTSLRGPPTAHV